MPRKRLPVSTRGILYSAWQKSLPATRCERYNGYKSSATYALNQIDCAIACTVFDGVRNARYVLDGIQSV